MRHKEKKHRVSICNTVDYELICIFQEITNICTLGVFIIQRCQHHLVTRFLLLLCSDI